MIVAADASFLVSLYGGDWNTPAARAWMAANAEPVLLTGALRFESENALRLACFRGRITAAELAQALADIAGDLDQGILSRLPLLPKCTGKNAAASAQRRPFRPGRAPMTSHMLPPQCFWERSFSSVSMSANANLRHNWASK